MKRTVQKLAKLLKENNLTIACAESMTCGLVAYNLGSVSGASKILKGGVVCYDEEVKNGLMKINKSLINKHTAESQQVTDALALNLKKIIKADVHVAITGLASPGGSETKSKPVGTVFYSLVFRDKLFKNKKKFRGSPMEIKKRACKDLFAFIVQKIKVNI